MKTRIIYEDEDIIVCNKPAGIAVQTQNCMQADVVSELKNYLKTSYIGVIHRLDQPVEGVLVFAKTQKAAAVLSAQVQNGQMKKIYRARVVGEVECKEAVLEDMLYKDGQTNSSQVADEKFLKGPKGKLAKKAKLFYRVLSQERSGEDVVTDLEVNLATGRHHQIRVQLSHMGNPILGDTKYGTDRSIQIAKQRGCGLCLTAYQLSFLHPETKKRMVFYAK